MNINPSYRRDSYDRGQWQKWLLLLEMTNAIEFGFAKYRLPAVGKPINVAGALNNVQRIEREWEAERKRRDTGLQYWYPTVPDLTKMPKGAQLYLHDVSMTLRERFRREEPMSSYSYSNTTSTTGNDYYG